MPVAEQPQVLHALAIANERRRKRTAIKREIKAGEVRVSDLLRQECLACLLTMPVEDLLTSIRYMPRKVVHRLMREVPIVPTATVGRLTERQRNALAYALDARESTPSKTTTEAGLTASDRSSR